MGNGAERLKRAAGGVQLPSFALDPCLNAPEYDAGEMALRWVGEGTSNLAVINKRDLSERDICTKYITPAVTEAGWDLMDQVREEVYFTKGRIIVRGKLVTRGETEVLERNGQRKRGTNARSIPALASDSATWRVTPRCCSARSKTLITFFVIEFSTVGIQRYWALADVSCR